MRAQRVGMGVVANELGRHRSTVYREVKRNRSIYDGAYRATPAMEKTNGRRRQSRRNLRYGAVRVRANRADAARAMESGPDPLRELRRCVSDSENIPRTTSPCTSVDSSIAILGMMADVKAAFVAGLYPIRTRSHQTRCGRPCSFCRGLRTRWSGLSSQAGFGDSGRSYRAKWCLRRVAGWRAS